MINEAINKETLERAEESMQYFKGHKFVLLKVYNIIDTGLDIIFFNPIWFEQRKGSRFHRNGIFYANATSFEVCVNFLREHSLMSC